MDAEVADQLERAASRREAFRQFGSLGAKAALAAIPLGLGAVLRTPARAGIRGTQVEDVLNLALTLEYLEDEFYAMGLDAAGLIPAADRPVFEQIGKHERAHVVFLQNALGDAAISKPTFDFTVGGAFDPFGDYPTFMALAQAFEDTGVRAYKGQAGNLLAGRNNPTLTAALSIHGVEARHASEVRRMRQRMNNGDPNLKGWITRNNRGAGMPPQTQAVYDGEENVVQGGVDQRTIPTINAFGEDLITSAYDEILTGDEAVAIASLFIQP